MNKRTIYLFTLLIGLSIAFSSCASHSRGCGCGSFSKLEQTQDRPQ